MFTLVSIVEMARGMWIYHTLAYAVKEGTRYTIVHGANCDQKINPSNNCQVTVSQIAQVIKYSGVGLDPSSLKVEMKSASDDTGLATLQTLLSSSTVFPTNPGYLQGSPITFTAQYPFQSAIAMFWPGAGGGMRFPTFTLPATSQENVQF